MPTDEEPGRKPLTTSFPSWGCRLGHTTWNEIHDIRQHYRRESTGELERRQGEHHGLKLAINKHGYLSVWTRVA